MPLLEQKEDRIQKSPRAVDNHRLTRLSAYNRLRQKENSAYQDRRPRQAKLTTVNNPSPTPLVDKALPGSAWDYIHTSFQEPRASPGPTECAHNNGMVTARISPGANNMNGELGKKSVRGQNTTIPTLPRAKQGPYVTPRLATNVRDARREDRIVSPRIERIDEDATISPNVTPRSAARRVRGTSSAESTPDATPLPTPASSRPTSMVSPSLQSRNIRAEITTRPSLIRSPTDHATGSRFFLASDAPTRRSRSPGPQVKPACFVYANGEEEALPTNAGKREGRRTSRSLGRPQAADTSFQKRRMASRSPSTASQVRPKTQSSMQQGADQIRPRFVSPQAPGLAQKPLPLTRVQSSPSAAPVGDLTSARTYQTSPRTSPEPDQSSQLRTSPELRILSRTIRGAAPRSKSPLKKFNVGSITSPPQRRISVTESTVLSPAEQRKSAGSSSVEDDRPGDVARPAPVITGLASPLSPSSPIRASLTTSALLYSVPGSPTKRDSGELSTTVADARRERKILDLEISNNSLLAFNRSLEKEVRKLKAEVRRHRRLTSASAISDVSTIALSATDSVNLDGQANIESESEQSDGASTLSEGHAAEQKARDERRLQRDFSKHKQLLDDSREMNSSIKRCLDATSLMIADAKRALSAEVFLDDDIGGRVLHDDDGGVVHETRKGLLSPINEGGIKWDTLRDDDAEMLGEQTDLA